MQLHLMSTNDPSSEESMREIRALMAPSLREIAQTRLQIASLETQLRALKEHCTALEAPLHEYRAILSPIRRLPDDVLCEIFYHCLPTHRNSILRADEAPLLLTRISNRWRSLALSSPRLWAQLYIPFCDEYCIAMPLGPQDSAGTRAHAAEVDLQRKKTFEVLTQRAEVVKDWLGHSGTCPLSISISFTSILRNPRGLEGYNHPQDPTMNLFRIILSHSHHLHSLELVMPVEIYRRFDKLLVSDPSAALSSGPDGVMHIDLSALRDLKTNLYYGQLHSPGLDTNHTTQVHPLALLSAPNLQRVSLDGFPSNQLGAQKPLPFSQGGKVLRYFVCNLTYSREVCLGILRECPNLEYCKFNLGPFPNSNSNGSGTPSAMRERDRSVFLPKLRTFIIVDARGSDYEGDKIGSAQFFSAIDAPNLLWLDYQAIYYEDEPRRLNHLTSNPTPTPARTHAHPLLPLLYKSHSLQKLTIDPHSFIPADLRESLRAVSPTVSHLVIGQEAMLRAPWPSRGPQRFDAFGNVTLDFDFLIVGGLQQKNEGEDEDEDKNQSREASEAETEVFLPHLERLEISTGQITDDTLLRIIISRMDASFSTSTSSSASPPSFATTTTPFSTSTRTPRCAPLKFVRVLFTRPKKLDIEKALVQYRRAEHERTTTDTGTATTRGQGDAGTSTDATSSINPSGLRIELLYNAQSAPIIVDPLSPSYGLQNDRSWPHLELDLNYGS